MPKGSQEMCEGQGAGNLGKHGDRAAGQGLLPDDNIKPHTAGLQSLKAKGS